MAGQQFVETQIRELCGRSGCDRIFILTDSNVAPLVPDFFRDEPRLVIEAGEANKSLGSAERIWNFLVEGGALRRSGLVNVGGGMITDLGGFAAATFKRGINFVNVPTTLLGAVDAAVGGKTGIDFHGLKNELGAFALPLGVFPLTSLFSSLSHEEWLSGVGECIKTGLLCSEELFNLVTSEDFVINRNPAVVEEVVKRCQEFKEEVVNKDLRDNGIRKMLNLGHTAGHAIESWKLAQGTPLPHGIAVAHGILFALRKSSLLRDANPELPSRYEAILRKYFPPLDMSERQLEEAWRYMAHDKKNLKFGEPDWVLLKDIGEPLVKVL